MNLPLLTLIMISPVQKRLWILTVTGTLFISHTTKSRAQVVWTGAGGSDDWAIGANWSGGTPPPLSSTTWLQFDPSLVNHSAASSPWDINRIDFSKYFYISGSALSFLGTAPQINGEGQINNPINIGAGGLNITGGVDLQGIVSGNGSLIASGYVSFGGAALNSYAGVVINQSATISFRQEGDLGTVPITDADNIILNGGSAQFLYTSSLSSTRRILLNGAGAPSNTIRSFQLLTIPGEVRGTGSLSIEGEVKLAGNNTYTGGTIVSGGTSIGGHGSTLSLTSLGALGGVGANVTIQTGGALSADYPIDQNLLSRVNPISTGSVTLGANSANPLDFQTSGLTGVRLGASAGSLTYSGPLTPAAGTYRLGGGSGRLVVESLLSGSARLDVGSNDKRRGSVVLAAPNTYSGGSTVGNGGILLLTPSGSTGTGLVTVNTGGIFGGNGLAAGAVAIASGGTMSPGIDGTGIITTGNLSFNGGTLDLTLAGPTAGTGYDQAHVLGTVLLGTSATLKFTLTYDATVGDSFTIIDNDLNDAPVGHFAGLTEGAQFFLINGKGGSLRPFEITYAGGTGNDVVIHATPEPGVVANLLLASGILASARFRRTEK